MLLSAMTASSEVISIGLVLGVITAALLCLFFLSLFIVILLSTIPVLFGLLIAMFTGSTLCYQSPPAAEGNRMSSSPSARRSLRSETG